MNYKKLVARLSTSALPMVLHLSAEDTELKRRIDYAVEFGLWLHTMYAQMDLAAEKLGIPGAMVILADSLGKLDLIDAETLWIDGFAWALYLESRIEELKK